MRCGKGQSDDRRPSFGHAGFTLVELLVVVGVLGLLMGIVVPALTRAQQAARLLMGSNRQREIVLALNLYAADHRSRYPESVATAAMASDTWRWQEPRMMKACRPRIGGYHCSMATYLGAYLPKPATLTCPSSPAPYRYLEELWRAGELWDNPDTSYLDDSALGDFCFYWNYVGHLTEQKRPFRGPQTDYGRRGCSRMLVSDYFGHNNWRSPESFGSCECFPHAEVTADTDGAPAYWCGPPDSAADRAAVPLKLRAGFIDGHVETYQSAETTILEVAHDKTPDGTLPAFSGLDLGPGQFFIPRAAAGTRP